MKKEIVNIALIGAGYWGANLGRNLAASNACNLAYVADANLEAAKALAERLGVEASNDIDAVVANPNVDALVIATPASTHYDLGRAGLETGKHVLIEKPFAATRSEAEELRDLAAEKGLVAMTGHTFLYTSAIDFLKETVDSGDLGELVYAYSQRLNLGRIRSDCDAMWNFAPHDISIFDVFAESMPEAVTGSGHSYLQNDIADVVIAGIDYPGKFFASFHVSWLDPRKVRSLVLVGTEKMAVYDDTSPDRKIEIYDSHAYSESTGPDAGGFSGMSDHAWRTRPGSISVPRLPGGAEPLAAEVAGFCTAITEGTTPKASADHAVRVVATLEAVSESMTTGEQVRLA